MAYLFALLLPGLVGLFLAPAAMVVVGKKLKITNTNLNYKRLLLITFFALLLGGFFNSVSLYLGMGISALAFLIPIKNQLKTTWGQGILLAVTGIVTLALISYLGGLLLS